MKNKKKKHDKKAKKGIRKKDLIKEILALFSANPSYTYNYKQIAKELNIKDDGPRMMITEVLYELKFGGTLEEVYTGKFKLKALVGYAIGLIEINNDGTAIVATDDNREIFIPEFRLNHALHGDRVQVLISHRVRRNLPEGEVVKVIERAKRNFVGTISLERNYAFLIPDNKQMPYDIFIAQKDLKKAKNGQKVIARITDWPANMKNPNGEVIEVLGNPGVNEVEMHAILAEFDLPYRFPVELDAVANKISETITTRDYNQRKDFRDIPTFTIDPVDAKDFDDALSFKVLPNGNYEVGVHIADVTHYVEPNSPIDMEAIDRATSVYLVDRCVPMLPERLSNFICSLRPNEEKLCFSAVFEMSDTAEILNTWFGRTVIFSKRRFTYEEAQAVIETRKGDMLNEILKLHELAQILRKNRYKTGAIGFERTEVKFDLDKTGKPLGVFFKENKESNQLIEEFMLLANKKVAELIGRVKDKQRAKPFVYRIHDKPNPEKFDSFRNFITRFGYNVEGGTDKQISKSLNKLMDEVKGKKEQNLIETLALRSMAKARYSTNNIGHYGLAFQHYTHFTSPIRRYPDMMVHRLLAHYLNHGAPEDQQTLEKLCKHSSEMEVRATEAERASIKYKQVEFMSDKIGQTFTGVISGVAGFGLFVELIDSKCEGMVPIRELDDDFYEFDEDNYCLVGKQTAKKFQLGDEVKIEVWRTNLAKKHLDFKLVSDNPIKQTSFKKQMKPRRKR
ncbi:MAG TPA: ribonuclease R [Bacteroidales bacterium]|nr:ribonuclease R [Bacteroidales bacterium]